MRELGLSLAIVAAWFVVVRWVLPYFGIATCCAGRSCQVERPVETEPDTVDKETVR
jgi:hypothetical protein